MKSPTRWALALGLLVGWFASAGCATTKNSPRHPEVAKTERTAEPGEPERAEKAEQVEGPAASVDLSIPEEPAPPPEPAGDFESVTVKGDEDGTCQMSYGMTGSFRTTNDGGASEDCPWPEGEHEWDVPTDVRREIASVVDTALADPGPTDPLVRAGVQRDWGTESVSIASEAGAQVTALLKPELQTTWLQIPGEIDEISVSARVPDERLTIFRVHPNGHVRILFIVPEKGKGWVIKREMTVGLSDSQANAMERAIQTAYTALGERAEEATAAEQRDETSRRWSFTLRGEDVDLSTTVRVPPAETPPRWAAEIIDILKEAVRPPEMTDQKAR